jgi:hypothetical protein
MTPRRQPGPVLRETGLVAVLHGRSGDRLAIAVPENREGLPALADLGEIAGPARSGARVRGTSPIWPRSAAEVAVPVRPST